MHVYRTHTCGELRPTDAGRTVRISGWLHRKRDHGQLLFVDLRDHYGLTQCVIDTSSPLFAKLEAVRLEGNDRKQSVDFVFTPRRPGEYLLIAKIPAREDERTDQNNVLTHRLRVADDKIKVLFVDHQPRYEYRFLKSALIRDTKILVHVLLTNADEGFPQPRQPDEHRARDWHQPRQPRETSAQQTGGAYARSRATSNLATDRSG